MGGFGGNPRVALPFGGGGGVGQIELFSGDGVTTGTCTNPAAGTFKQFDVGLIYRRLLDLRAVQQVRCYAYMDSNIAATKIQIRYHLSTDLNISGVAAGWHVLLTSAGSHTGATWLLTDPVDIPQEARVAPVMVEPGIFGGDGVADPQVWAIYLLVT